MKHSLRALLGCGVAFYPGFGKVYVEPKRKREIHCKLTEECRAEARVGSTWEEKIPERGEGASPIQSQISCDVTYNKYLLLSVKTRDSSVFSMGYLSHVLYSHVMQFTRRFTF